MTETEEEAEEEILEVRGTLRGAEEDNTKPQNKSNIYWLLRLVKLLKLLRL